MKSKNQTAFPISDHVMLVAGCQLAFRSLRVKHIGELRLRPGPHSSRPATPKRLLAIASPLQASRRATKGLKNGADSEISRVYHMCAPPISNGVSGSLDSISYTRLGRVLTRAIFRAALFCRSSCWSIKYHSRGSTFSLHSQALPI